MIDEASWVYNKWFKQRNAEVELLQYYRKQLFSDKKNLNRYVLAYIFIHNTTRHIRIIFQSIVQFYHLYLNVQVSSSKLVRIKWLSSLLLKLFEMKEAIKHRYKKYNLLLRLFREGKLILWLFHYYIIGNIFMAKQVFTSNNMWKWCPVFVAHTISNSHQRLILPTIISRKDIKSRHCYVTDEEVKGNMLLLYTDLKFI